MDRLAARGTAPDFLVVAVVEYLIVVGIVVVVVDGSRARWDRFLTSLLGEEGIVNLRLLLVVEEERAECLGRMG